MFYSASQSQMIVLVQTAERSNFGPGSPAARVEHGRRPESQRIDMTPSAAAPVRARRWPMSRANVTGEA
jgi:hypothetical protein